MLRDALLTRWEQKLPAVLGQGNPVSYAELAKQAACVQATLPSVDNQSIAAILLPDGGDFLAALFGILQAGWVAFPLNVHLTVDELSELLCQAPVRAVVTSDALGPLCRQAVNSCVETPDILLMDTLPTLSGPQPALHAVDPGLPILLLASSGTTGRAKLVQLSETNMAFNVLAYLRHMGYEKYHETEPRYALGTPLTAIYGLLVSFSCVLRGFPLLPMAEGFTLDALYRASQEYGISHYDGGTLVAVLMDRTLGHPIPYDISALRYFGFGGSKAPEGTLERLSAAYPKIRFWSGYGMTEASPLIAQPFQELPPDKLGSVGVPLPGVTVCLETVDGRTDAPGQPGEIVARGPNIMLGYYGDETATKEIVRDGWLHTGDIGYFDEDGYLYICGRKKNMLLVRGFNVYPEEVETCLLGCPQVRDCVVYGDIEKMGTETVLADVVPSGPDTTVEGIQRWCAEHLADYKRPHKIRLLKQLEKTSTGKNRRV